MIRRIVYAAVILIAIPLDHLGTLENEAGGAAGRASHRWIDTVKRGPMLRQVRGLGTLVPEEILWLPALTDGQIEKILLRPGRERQAGHGRDGAQQSAAPAGCAECRMAGEIGRSNVPGSGSEAAEHEARPAGGRGACGFRYQQAKLNADVESKLSEQGLTSDVKVKTTKAIADELANRARH